MTATVTNSDGMVITLNVSSIVSIVIRRHNSKKKQQENKSITRKKFETYIEKKFQNLYVSFFLAGVKHGFKMFVFFIMLTFLFFVSLLSFDFISKAFYVGFSTQSMTKVNEGKVRAKWKIREKRS